MHPSTHIDQHVQDLKAHIDVWARELKASLGYADIGHSIGVSFEPAVKLDRVPGEEVVEQGLYRPLGYAPIQDNLAERVEVLQPSRQGMVIFRTFYTPGIDDLSTMSVAHFLKLYTPVDPKALPGR